MFFTLIELPWPCHLMQGSDANVFFTFISLGFFVKFDISYVKMDTFHPWTLYPSEFYLYPIIAILHCTVIVQEPFFEGQVFLTRQVHSIIDHNTPKQK